MGISFPLRGRTKEILLAFKFEDELGTGDILSQMQNPSRKSIHELLQRLEKNGLLKSRVEKIPGERNRPRRFFRLTQNGRQTVELNEAFAELCKRRDRQNEERLN